MTEHLSGRRIAETAGVGATVEERRHLYECPQCGQQLARLETAIACFRDGICSWSSTEGEAARFRVAARREPKMWVRRLVLAAAALMLCSAPSYRYYRSVLDHQRAVQEVADAQLLEQVNQEITEAVPTPMAPLEQLVTWSPVSKGN